MCLCVKMNISPDAGSCTILYIHISDKVKVLYALMQNADNVVIYMIMVIFSYLIIGRLEGPFIYIYMTS